MAMDAVIDAAGPDAPPSCVCPGAEVLASTRVIRDTFNARAPGGSVVDCKSSDGFLLTGSCFVDELEPRMKLNGYGFTEYEGISLEGWSCSWNSPDSRTRDHINTAVCLTGRPAVPEAPPDCVCPVVESLEERFIRSEQTGTLPAGMNKRVTASCPGEALLVAGSCILPFRTTIDNYLANLISAGFATNEAGKDVWECAWSNGSTVSLSPSVVAMCLRPPMAGTAPEAEPTASRLVRVEQRDTLPAGTSFLHEATCADGDYLLRGGCTIEDPEAAPRDLNIFRAGFLPESNNRPNTWQCGWNNPSTSTPTAIATALCLKPPSAP